MTEDLSVESNEKLVALTVTIEETFEELERELRRNWRQITTRRWSSI